jgi:hypothetical protein
VAARATGSAASAADIASADADAGSDGDADADIDEVRGADRPVRRLAHADPAAHTRNTDATWNASGQGDTGTHADTHTFSITAAATDFRGGAVAGPVVHSVSTVGG